MTVLDALSTTPQTKLELAVALGWKTRTGAPDTRRVESEIQAARLAGVAICSDASGYRKPRNAADFEATVDGLRSRALSQLHTYAAQRRALLRMAAEEAKPLAWTWDEEKAA
jgi:hypothetical protein